jgi:hypothetical protein
MHTSSVWRQHRVRRLQHVGFAGGLFRDLRSLLANGLGGSTMALMGRQEFDAEVAVPMVVAVENRRYPFECLVIAGRGCLGKPRAGGGGNDLPGAVPNRRSIQSR